MNTSSLPAPPSKLNRVLDATTKAFPYRAVLGVVVALVFCARLALALRFDLFPDELLYAWQSQTMPGAFCPHPPGTLLLVKAGIAIFGKTALGVRFFPLLVSTLIVVPMWLLAREIGASQNNEEPIAHGRERAELVATAETSDLNIARGETLAFWSVLAILAAPIYFAFGAITTPDGAQLFFWTSALFCAWRALNSEKTTWWILLGATIGIGLFFKYILILFFPALFACLLLVPQWRGFGRTAKPYLSLMIALLIFVPPFLQFEYSNGWMTLQYHLGHRQNRQWPNALDILSYQGIHAAYISPLLYIAAIWGAIWALRRGRKIGGRETRGRENGSNALIFLFCFAAIPYLFFALIASITKRDLSREQWDAPAYLSALLAAMWMAQTKIAESARAASSENVSSKNASSKNASWKKWRIAALGLGFALSLALVAEATTSVWSRALGAKPFLSNLHYTQQMARQVDQRLQKTSFKPDFLVGGNFTVTLAYAFYGHKIARVVTAGDGFNARYGLLGVLKDISISDDFAQRERGRNILFVYEENDISPKWNKARARQLEKLRSCFDSVEGAPLDIFYEDRFVTRFYVFQCRGLKKTPALWLR